MERLKSTLAESERQRRTIADRLTMLKNWRQSMSGYSDGVRTLLRAPAGKFSGLIGPVPQLGVVPAGMEIALEAALGSYMQAVVVRTLDDARQCLEYLKNARTGKAMVVWVEREGEDERTVEISAIQGQVEEDVLRRFLAERPSLQSRTAGFAWQQIQCESRYKALFRRILHGIVIVRDLEAARELLAWAIPLSLSSDNDLPFVMVVTLDGEVLHVDGWLTGGTGKDGQQQGLLAYERELRELPQQREQHRRRAEQAALDKELQKITARLNELNKVIGTSQREQERLQTEIRMAVPIEQQLASEVAGLEQEVQAAQERVQAHEKTQREITGLVEELQQEMEERALTYRRQQDELGRARTALAVKRQEAKSLRQQLASLHVQIQDVKGQVEQQVARLKENEQRKQWLQETLTQHQTELAGGREQSQNLAGEVRLIEAQLGEVDRQIMTLEQQRIQTQQTLTELEGLYRRYILESQKARDAVEALLEQLREEMEIEDPAELPGHITRLEVSAEAGAVNGNSQVASTDEAGE